MAEKTSKKKSATKSKKAVAQNKKSTTKKGSKATASAGKTAESKSNSGKKTLSNEINGIIIIAIGLFLLFAFLSELTGAVGVVIKSVFYGLFGVASSVSCVFVIITGYQIFVNKGDRKNSTRATFLVCLILITSVLVTLISGETEIDGNGLIEQIAYLYQCGIEAIGGGVIGGGICKILVQLIGTAGTWILTIAAELIFVILLTGVSIENIFRHFGVAVKRQSERVKERAEEEVEFVEELEKPEEKEKKGGFFDSYFKGKDAVENQPVPDRVEDGPKEKRRFVFERDDDILDEIVPEKAEINPDEGLPFKIDNMKTGVLSELPFTDEEGKVVPVKNPEDEDEEFVPPTEAQLEDVPEPSTKAAMDAGVALDRAVVVGRKMAVEGELTPEQEIEEQLNESSASPQRITEYYMPTLDILDPPQPKKQSRDQVRAELEEKANRLLDTLQSFKVDAKIVNITQGPSVTRFELMPGVGVKVSKITGLTDDIALSLAAPGVRISPIPGKSAIGVEIPNKEASPVPIREVLESDKFQNFQSKTAFALGKDIAGSCVVADIAKFPHVLIAGQTGSGKSVCINSLILSILYKAKPDEVKMIMVDPKMVELGIYNGIPHLLIPVVTDPKHAAGALNWAVVEMQNRYNLLKDNNVRNLKGYNALMEERGEPESKLPEIVIIIDEFADLMIVAKNEVENAINRLAALARAAGMYLVIATQRPTVNVITGVIKANIPSRIAFNVTSQVDSRTIIDVAGAEKLLGRGDMLYNPSGAMKPMRLQGNFVSDAEIERVIDFIKGQYEACYDEEIMENIQREQERINDSLANNSYQDDDDFPAAHSGGESKDELFFQAVEMVLENGQASVAMFQRRFKIGYQRAARLIDQMEERRIIGPYEGTKPRQVLISRQEFNEMRMNEAE